MKILLNYTFSKKLASANPRKGIKNAHIGIMYFIVSAGKIKIPKNIRTTYIKKAKIKYFISTFLSMNYTLSEPICVLSIGVFLPN